MSEPLDYSFVQCKTEKCRREIAMLYLRELVEAGKPVPEILMPYVYEACEAYDRSHGHAIKSAITNRKWEEIIYYVRDLMRDTTKKEAIKIAAIKYSCSVSTIEDRYKKHKDARRSEEMDFESRAYTSELFKKMK